MNWLRETSELNDWQFEIAAGEEPLLKTFTWSFETRSAKTEVKSLSNILQINDDTSVVLVTIPCPFDDSMDYSRQGLDQLLAHFGLDRRVMALFKVAHLDLYLHPTDACSSSYIATGFEKLIWAHDTSQRLIRGVVFATVEPGPDVKTIPHILEIELADMSMMECPTLLPWAALASASCFFMERKNGDIRRLYELEKTTGHGGRTNDENVEVIEDLSVASKQTASLNVDLAQGVKNIAGNRAMAKKLLSLDHGTREDASDLGTPCQGFMARRKLMAGSLEFLIKLLNGFEFESARCLQRAELQMTLINHMISHREAETSNSLAKTNADQADASYRIATESKTLTEQARQDAASMKTIAIMTMAFLPGTFFAALFSMPSLAPDQGGDATGGVQSNFGLYWAITLPVTAAILALWYLINRTDEERQVERKIATWAQSKLSFDWEKTKENCRGI